MPTDCPEEGDACDVGLVQREGSVLGSALGRASSYQGVDFRLPKWPDEHPQTGSTTSASLRSEKKVWRRQR